MFARGNNSSFEKSQPAEINCDVKLAVLPTIKYQARHEPLACWLQDCLTYCLFRLLAGVARVMGETCTGRQDEAGAYNFMCHYTPEEQNPLQITAYVYWQLMGDEIICGSFCCSLGMFSNVCLMKVSDISKCSVLIKL